MARHDRAALPGPPRAVPLVPQAAPRATAPRPLSRALLRHGYWSRRAQRADRARQAAQLRRPATSAGCRTYRHCAEAAGEPAGCGSPMCSMQDRRARFSVMVSHSRVEREHHHHLHHRFRPGPCSLTSSAIPKPPPQCNAHPSGNAAPATNNGGPGTGGGQRSCTSADRARLPTDRLLMRERQHLATPGAHAPVGVRREAAGHPAHPPRARRRWHVHERHRLGR